MYEKLLKQLTVGCRCMIGAVLLLGGIVWQILSGKTLDMYAFYIMAAAMLCFVNVITEKMMKAKVDPVLYLLINMLLLIIGFVISESEMVDGTMMYTIWGVCVILDWVANAILLRCEGIAKRVVVGLIATLLNILLIGAVFIIPVLITVFNS